MIGARDPLTGEIYAATLVNKVTGATGFPGSATLLVAEGAAGSALDHSLAGAVGPSGATGTLLKTVLSNPGRNAWGIQNLGASEVYVQRSETVTGPSGPTAVAGTSTVLAFAPGASGPAAPYESRTFKGQLQVFGPTGYTGAAVYED
jgi:hypothetical protein